MDEPLSNLDAKLRLGMRYELQRLHVTTGATFVYVTHDQMEAMTLATKICLMNNGVLQQYDAPLDVYLKPNNTFTADFVGNPSINFMEAKGKQAGDGSIALEILNGKKVTFTPKEALTMDKWFKERDEAESKKVVIDKQNKDELFKPRIDKVVEDHAEEKKEVMNEDFFIGVRPEYIHICENGAFEAEVYGAMPTGMESTLKLKLDNFLLTSVVFGSTAFAIGQKVRFDIGGDGILLFDRKSGKRICNGSVK
jgi:ABC-type sugar transport system ATPase subunit